MIKVLEKNVIDKIAAGEVVEKPVSIVKELVENAIDAGATSIICEIKKGGKTYIRISDNGKGIPSEEVETAFLRYATSKINNAEDLYALNTLGFRGEALSSISAVSRTELITKTEESNHGTQVYIEGSDLKEKSSIGCEKGTNVIVRDLFYNTPARLKFMKSDSSESSQIIDFMGQIALAYPHIKIRMINNENILFSTQGKGDTYNSIMSIFGKDIQSKLLPVENEIEGLKIKGYISSPEESRSNKKHQIFFVNGRVINSKIIEKAIKEAYKERLFDGRYPITYLFLEVSPDSLDVNIHPNKREVKFYDEKKIIEFIKISILEALSIKNAIPNIKSDVNIFTKSSLNTKENKKAKEDRLDNLMAKKREEIKENRKSCTEEIDEEVHKSLEKQVDIKNILSDLRKDSENETSVIKEELSSNEYISDSSPLHEQNKTSQRLNTPFEFEDLILKDSIFDSYIMATDKDHLYLIDQHAAHERIFFENLLSDFNSGEKAKQELMIPVTFDVPFTDENWIEPLNKMGFIVEEFGPNTYSLRAIPLSFEIDMAESFIKDYVDNIGDDLKNFNNDDILNKIATRACKSAVKANNALSIEEIRALMKDLSKCNNPFSCPHGRPTFIKLSKYEIEKRFKRV